MNAETRYIYKEIKNLIVFYMIDHLVSAVVIISLESILGIAIYLP